MDSLCVDTAVPKKNSIWIFTYSHFFAHLLPAFVDKKNIVLGNQLIILLQFCHPNYTSIKLVKPTKHSSNPVPSNSNPVIRIKETKRPNHPFIYWTLANQSSNPVPSNPNPIIHTKETKHPNHPIYILHTDQPANHSESPLLQQQQPIHH